MLRVLVLGAVAVLVAPLEAAEPFDWKKTLEQPLSPGSIALLVENAGEPEVQERWRAALHDTAPEVRAAAARAIYAANAKNLVPALKEALATGGERRGGREQIRALVSLGDVSDDAAVIAAGKRLTNVRTTAWILLGRARGIEALEYLPTVREIDGTGDGRRSLVCAAIRGGRFGVAEAAAAALSQDDAEAWYVVWDAASIGADLADEFVARSIASGNPRVRAITYWNAAMFMDAGAKMLPALDKAFDAAREAGLDPRSAPASWREHEARFSYGS